MADWSVSVDRRAVSRFSSRDHLLLTVSDFLKAPDDAVNAAFLQKFAKITPQYPGVRAPLEPEVQLSIAKAVSPVLSETFHEPEGQWQIMAWYSLVTCPPQELLPIQRMPHVDGTDPRQLAMMLYLHQTDHGGTAFFRHRSTGSEDLTDASFPEYRRALESDVAKHGLPPACYTTDGEPMFERTHKVDGAFNEAVFYRGNILHSGMIDNTAPLSADPRKGRLTINAFLRPPGA